MTEPQQEDTSTSAQSLAIHPVVFPASAALVLLFVAIAAMRPAKTMDVFSSWQAFIAGHFGGFYILSMTGFLLFAVYLAFSRFGKIRLGPDDVEPEFSRPTWFAMLFSAGMGIGMLFWGVAEPLYHFTGPPFGEPRTLEAANNAMAITLFHWCLHPWALYAIVALALAYFGFRRGLPLSFRSVFYPLLGERVHGWPGHLIDILAVCATLFGLATSLGLGAKQVNAGLYDVAGLPISVTNQVLLIACITGAAVLSLASGLDRGIRRLSEINMALAAFLLLFMFIAGPTLYLLTALFKNTAAYAAMLPANSFAMGGYEGEEGAAWLGSWTVFYWGWWIAWSPFVGMFIARISRGRTIREFLLGTLLAPTLIAILWMTAMGSTALHQETQRLLAEDAPGSGFEYTYNNYMVQTLDKETGLPQKQPESTLGSTKVLIANGLEISKNRQGLYVTPEKEVVALEDGIPTNPETGEPIVVPPEERYDEDYLAQIETLTVGLYLEKPIMNQERTKRIDTTATAMFVLLRSLPLADLTVVIGTLCVRPFLHHVIRLRLPRRRHHLLRRQPRSPHRHPPLLGHSRRRPRRRAITRRRPEGPPNRVDHDRPSVLLCRHRDVHKSVYRPTQRRQSLTRNRSSIAPSSLPRSAWQRTGCSKLRFVPALPRIATSLSFLGQKRSPFSTPECSTSYGMLLMKDLVIR